MVVLSFYFLVSLAELVIDLKAKKTAKLNMQLAKMMNRGEQAIQKIRTKTEYKQAEPRVRQIKRR